MGSINISVSVAMLAFSTWLIWLIVKVVCDIIAIKKFSGEDVGDYWDPDYFEMLMKKKLFDKPFYI